jgi:hypothetical protein
MRLVQWAMIGFILMAACVAELMCEKGNVNWGLGYWLIVTGALWGVSAGYRLRRRIASRIKEAIDRNLPAAETHRRLNARILLGMASASSVAYWGLVVRFALNGMLWQAVPFYVLGLALLLLWGPRASMPTSSN